MGESPKESPLHYVVAWGWRGSLASLGAHSLMPPWGGSTKYWEIVYEHLDWEIWILTKIKLIHPNNVWLEQPMLLDVAIMQLMDAHQENLFSEGTCFYQSVLL